MTTWPVAATPTRPGGRRAALAALLTSLALLTSFALAGCARQVEVTPAPAATEPACARVGAAWPEQVAGRARVATTSDSPAVAAWGDPAIIARCGVAPPAPTSADCISADGVDWVVRDLSDGRAFTSYGRTPALEVLVPRAYAPEPLVLAAFAPAAARIPQGEHRCS